mgnify:CR=1 FL=1
MGSNSENLIWFIKANECLLCRAWWNNFPHVICKEKKENQIREKQSNHTNDQEIDHQTVFVLGT